MNLEKIISYSGAALSSSSDLEKIENNSRVALKPRNEFGNHITGLLHFDETNLDETYHRARYFKDSAYGEEAFCVGAKWDGTVKKFGDASLKIDSPKAVVNLPYNARYNNLPNFTIDFFVRFSDVSGDKSLVNEFYYLSQSHRGRFHVYRTGTNIRFMAFNSAGQTSTLTSSGVTLQTNTWYHIRVVYYSMGDGSSIGKISVNGIARGQSNSMRLLPTLDKSICPKITIGGMYDHLNPFFNYAAYAYFDELTIYNILLSDTYTPPDSAMAPFKTTGGYVRLTLDAGAGAVWDMSSMSFLDESDFDSGGIKISYEMDNDNTPSWPDNPLTLAQFKAESDPSDKRYMHLEFPFYSDGDTKVVLFPGSIQVSQSSFQKRSRALLSPGQLRVAA